MGFYFLIYSNVSRHAPYFSFKTLKKICYIKVLKSFKILVCLKIVWISIFVFYLLGLHNISQSSSLSKPYKFAKKKDASRFTEFHRVFIHTHLKFSHRHLLLDIWLITQKLSNTNDTLFSLHS